MSIATTRRWTSVFAVLIAGATVFAESEKIGDYTWQYFIQDGKARIGTQKVEVAAVSPKPAGSVVVPSELGGYEVYRIDAYAFYGCTEITNLYFPDTIYQIGGHAVQGCNMLMDVHLPSNLQYVAGNSFRACSSLQEVHIPQNVEKIDENAFDGCTSLTNIVINDGVKRIGEMAFANCCSLTTIKIPPSVTNIQTKVFFGCGSVTSLTLPFVGSERGNSWTADSVFGYIFGTSSFSGGVKIKQNYTSSLSAEYFIPSSLKSVIITDETVIGYGAFQNCSMLTSVILPDSATQMEDRSFQGCFNLTSIQLPVRAEHMGASQFSSCSNLISITLPQGVERTRGNQFENCTKLSEIELPEGLSHIGWYTFLNCSSLKHITIPSTVTGIDIRAFEGCTQLGIERITFNGNAPTLNVGADGMFHESSISVFENIAINRAYVKKNSSGWGVEIPGVWNDLLLCYDDHISSSGTWVASSNGLIALYNFNGDADDSSGNAYHLRKDTDMNWPVFTSDRFGRNSSAFLFNGQNNMGLKARGEAVRAVVSRTFTISFWFQTTASYSEGGSATSTYKGNFAIFPAHSGNTTSQGLGICVGRDGIRLKGHYAGDLPVLMTYSASIDSSWHHIAVTMLNNGAPEIYLDGRKVATGSTPTRTVNVGIRIGGDTYGYYTGKLDDVRIYNRALSASEIQALYELVEQPITYENLMGATHSNPEVYTEGGYGTFTPPVEPEGLEFMGWSPSAIASTDQGAVTVRASWGVPVSNDNEKVTVPLDWLDRSGVDLADGYQSAATNTTGKTDMGGKPMYVWQDYVAGTDPTNTDSRFTATISMTNDVPYITWSPNLNTNGIERIYTILGKTNLTDMVEWAPTNSAHKFFKVKVEMP